MKQNDGKFCWKGYEMAQQSPPSNYFHGSALSRSLTKQFYEWESRGRGQHLWGYPVDLVPPFVPFSRTQSARDVIRDDARLPSLLQSIFSGRKARPELKPNKLPN